MARPAARHLLALGLTIAALAIPSAARADDPTSPNEIVLTLGPEQKVDDLLRALTRLTNVPILWTPEDKAITYRKVTGATEIRSGKGALFDTVRGLLAAQEVVLIPMGAPHHEYFIAMDARALQSQFILKMKAVPVDLTDANLSDFESQDGLYVTATIAVKNLETLRDARTALQRMITQNNIGSVQEVPAARAFVVNDFAPNVVAIYRAIRRMDVVPPGRVTRAEFFDLRHANAKNVARVLEELFVDRAKPGTPGAPASADSPPPDVRISADPDSNQVIVIATDDKIVAMRPIVAKLDREPTPPK